MKRLLVLTGAMLVSLSVLAACNSDSGKQEDEGSNGKNEQENNRLEADQASTGFKDQTDLKIGDSGEAESTIGKYKITVNSVKRVDEIDGKTPSLDYYFIADMTVENIGDEPYDAMDIIDNLNFTKSLDSGGAGDFSNLHDSVKHFTGTIQPGESVTGEAVFQGQDSDVYYIKTIDGLIASGAVKNQTIWSFDINETE
ncbi:DUF4352 domain-containing protein [Sporosarcina luteola]|uniref:DUF4352 domain-containing protein n=1 Tax=Sporosarcina luteola TaxID=582850 RepID=UPI00203D199B|nr:DUF4352 domain-containing protein [Sporosarcina luteola]MCM3745133.1 DUF4352 domain-containing protein [Sporosarcina luteola]